MEKNNLLKNDPITIAVNKCNEILKELDLKVGHLQASGEPNKPYSMYEEKLYTNETIEKLLEDPKMKYYKVDWVDTYDYDHYPSWETEISLAQAVKEGSTNMQKVWSKVEITKEEYEARKR